MALWVSKGGGDAVVDAVQGMNGVLQFVV